ncbi:MAG: GTP-binding protein [ANME-2 cluster archaeon]|nr:GTP-binding protein [ANME-2 cluster archaeon]
MSLDEEITEIEDEIRKTSYNKATSHHIGRLKAKLARLKEDMVKRASSKGGGDGYSVRKSGDATVVLVGYPSVGKSTLLNRLTGAQSRVGAYEFTTLDVVPGTMFHKDATIQILDVPGLVRGAASGRGRGKEVISVVRNAELIIFLIDVFQTGHLQVLEKELYDAGIRVNTRRPDVKIVRKFRGGVGINSTVETELDRETILSILKEYKMHNADVLIRDNVNIDEFIDALLGNRKYIKAVTVINKADLVDEAFKTNLRANFPDAMLISADMDKNLDPLKDLIFDNLKFIRLYMKPQGEPADMDEPMIIQEGVSVGDICDKLHRDFRKRFRYAQVWGPSAKHAGQRAGLEHILMDGDVLTIVTQK